MRLIGQATNLKFASVSSSTTRLIHAGKGSSPATLLLAAPFTKKVTPNAVHNGMLFGKAVVEAVPQKHENKQNIYLFISNCFGLFVFSFFESASKMELHIR